MEITWDDRPSRKEGVWLQPDKDGASVFDPVGSRLHTLNSSAMAIWDLCDGVTSVGEMVIAICELTGQGIGEVQEQVLRTLKELRTTGLID